MSVPLPESASAQSGLVIPENIPGDDLKPTKLYEAASTLRAAGTGAATHADAAQTSWAGLPAIIQSPEGPVIYGALTAPGETAAIISTKFGKVADALDEYASALGAIKTTFTQIKTDAVAFRATIRADERVWISPRETQEYEFDSLASTAQSRGYVRTVEEVLLYLQGRGESTMVSGGRVRILAHWTQSSEHIDKNNGLMDRLADAYTRLQNAEADCANAINRQRGVPVSDVEYIEAWQLKQSGENTVVMPWGSRVDEERNCGEEFWWGAGNAGKHALEGVGALFGYNSLIGGWSWDKSWATAGQAWAGMFQGIGSLALMTFPLTPILGQLGVPVFKEATDTTTNMAKGLLAWDTWAEHPAEAAGTVLVNVGTFFIPGVGEVAGVIKGIATTSRIVDLASDAARLGDDVLAGVNKVDGFASQFDNFVGDAAGTAAKTDDLVSTGIRMPDGDVLHVGSKTDSAPPTPHVEDAPPAPRPHTGEPTPPPSHTGGGDAPTTPHGDLDGQPPHTDAGGPKTPDADDSASTAHGDGDVGGDGPGGAGSGPGEGGPIDPRSLDRQDPELGNNPDGTWDGKPGLHLDEADNATVQRFASESVAIEQRIGPELERIVDEAAPDSRLVGLDESVKYADSLKGKVAESLLNDPDLTVAGALAQVKDSVRYTVESTVVDYSSTVIHTVEKLQAEGYELIKFRDTWNAPGYKGINSSWVDPQTGRVFEVQFHTPESFVVKTVSHDVYDQLRTPGLPADEVARLTQLTEDAFAGLEVPPGAVELGERFNLGPTP